MGGEREWVRESEVVSLVSCWGVKLGRNVGGERFPGVWSEWVKFSFDMGIRDADRNGCDTQTVTYRRGTAKIQAPIRHFNEYLLVLLSGGNMLVSSHSSPGRVLPKLPKVQDSCCHLGYWGNVIVCRQDNLQPTAYFHRHSMQRALELLSYLCALLSPLSLCLTA